ncbi:probable inactive protein kinase DDB_G0270444 [Centruroides vittatus]|uniref:probable inactive protein kinase DDB_G0270444 n=1 Tax=Centruroides vittatus TaxID=120091 RepID=UPI003510A8BF
MGLPIGPPFFHVIEEEETPKETFVNVNTQIHQPPPPPKLNLEDILQDLEQFSKTDKRSPAGKLYKSLRDYVRFLNGEQLSSEENLKEAMLFLENIEKRKKVKKKLKQQKKKRMIADLANVPKIIDGECTCCKPKIKLQNRFLESLGTPDYNRKDIYAKRGDPTMKVTHLPDLSRVLGKQCALRTSNQVEYERALFKPGEKKPILKYKIGDKASSEELLQLPQDTKRKERRRDKNKKAGIKEKIGIGSKVTSKDITKQIGLKEKIDEAVKEKIMPEGEDELKERIKDIILDEEEILDINLDDYEKYVDKKDMLMARYRKEILKNDISDKYMMDIVMETEFDKLHLKQEEPIKEKKIQKPLVIAVKRNYPTKEHIKKPLIRKPIHRSTSSVDVNINKSCASVRVNVSKQKINDSDHSIDVKYGTGIHEYKQKYVDKVYFEEFKNVENNNKRQRISVKLHSRDSTRKYYMLDSGSESHISIHSCSGSCRRHDSCNIL